MTVCDAGLSFRGPAPAAGRQKRIDAVVLHHRAGSGDVQSIHADHLRRGWWGIGYHYYIRRDGSLWRGRPEVYCGSHAGASSGYNTHSIGICFEGNFEKEHPAAAQLDTCRALLADLMTRYPIQEVLRHRDLAATVCPGKYFPAAETLLPAKNAAPGASGDGGWWSEAVDWAVARGILKGDGSGNLHLDDPLSRKEGVTLLWRALSQGDGAGENGNGKHH